MANATDVPNCPKCNGPMYDNRNSKKNPKSPDFRCKDKSCVDDSGYATGVWLDKDAKKNGAAPKSTDKQGFTSGGPLPGVDSEHPEMPHEKLDRICAASQIFLSHVLLSELPLLVKSDIGATDQYVHSRVANLLITAERAGLFQ